ncbi:MAG TPA: hypothetical protein VNA16_06280 [Abditibacteriaceae bacterium]|nr:hypothetical protein [Abditibacteriaceae bacterium]
MPTAFTRVLPAILPLHARRTAHRLSLTLPVDRGSSRLAALARETRAFNR